MVKCNERVEYTYTIIQTIRTVKFSITQIMKTKQFAQSMPVDFRHS